MTLSNDPAAAVMVVANSGPGIPPEVADRVFERFFRAATHHRHAIEGSGLGLNIAQWIVHSHGGDIAIRTDGDGMTRATVRLPR